MSPAERELACTETQASSPWSPRRWPLKREARSNGRGGLRAGVPQPGLFCSTWCWKRDRVTVLPVPGVHSAFAEVTGKA